MSHVEFWSSIIGRMRLSTKAGSIVVVLYVGVSSAMVVVVIETV
jgi:hypothetical protein